MHPNKALVFFLNQQSPHSPDNVTVIRFATFSYILFFYRYLADYGHDDLDI